MRTSIIWLVVLILWLLPGPGNATIYKYVDDEGGLHYTNDLSSVPPDKLDQITEIEEIESDEETPPREPYSGPIYPLLQQIPSAEKLAKERERAKMKAALEAEYEALLKEKEALDNDASFQKRRYKRKYQNRPYIQELVQKEAELIRKLADLERQLNAF